MSDAKTQKKAVNGSNKPQVEKSDAGKSKAEKTAKTTDTTSGDSTKATPKSASQTSTSHFSSVSTPAYKSGWDNIFGRSKSGEKSALSSADDGYFPEQLTIDDEDIGEELRIALYKVFQKQARKQGVSLAKIKKRVDFSYTLNCDIEAK